MPRSFKSARVRLGSNFPAKSLPKAAPPSPQFTESSQPNPASSPDRSEKSPESANGLSPESHSLDATEPFPPGLFRVPVPNAVFSEMPEMSDSALRGLLALIHLSFRFDPAESDWVHSEDGFARSDVEDECGLSSQGTRNGLSELESIGWVRIDRSGRRHRFRLSLEVPTERFTYVPTALLERISDIDSGTELRVALAVLRGSWGWTCKETAPQSGSLRTVHDRWVQLSNRKLAEKTGRSETAVTEATKASQGQWIERVRPGSGPHQYRFLPEAVGDESGAPDSFCETTSNNLTPDRQKSGTPTFNKKSSSKDKHSRPQKKERPEPAGAGPSEPGRAVPSGNPSEQRRNYREQKTGGTRQEDPAAADFSDLPAEKQDLAEKLRNVGVWAGRIADLLSRFSPRRIRANFELYRRRAAQQTIRKPGAWLYEAIAEGYALPGVESGPEGRTAEESGPRPTPGHKETLSEAKKDAFVAEGLDEERFHRCLSPDGGSSAPQFMYFDPNLGGPTSRT